MEYAITVANIVGIHKSAYMKYKHFSLFKNIRSFTLIEMLIVIVIIGILAAALVPRLTNIQSRARNVKRETDITTLTNAIKIYYLDRADYPQSFRYLVTGDILTSIPSDPQMAARHPCHFWEAGWGTDPLVGGAYLVSGFYDTTASYAISPDYFSMANNGYMYASCANSTQCDYGWVGAMMENDGSTNSYGSMEGTGVYHACFWGRNTAERSTQGTYGRYNAYLNMQNEMAGGLTSKGKIFLRLFFNGNLLY